VGKKSGPKTGEMMPAMAEMTFDAGGEFGVGHGFEPDPPGNVRPAL